MRLNYCILGLLLSAILPSQAIASSEGSRTFMTLCQKTDYNCLRDEGACDEEALALIKQKHAQEALERECGACLENYADYEKFGEGSLLAVTKCNHFFCEPCLSGHLKDSPGECPECRHRLDPKDKDDVALVPLSGYRNFWFRNNLSYADYQAARTRKAGHAYPFTQSNDRTIIAAIRLMQTDGLDEEIDFAKGQEALLRYYSDHFERLIKQWWFSLKDTQSPAERSPTQAFAAAAFVRIELLSLAAADLPATAANLAQSKGNYELRGVALHAQRQSNRREEAAMARRLIEPFVEGSYRKGIVDIVTSFKKQALRQVPKDIVAVLEKGDEDDESTDAEIISLTEALADVFYLLWLADHSRPVVIEALGWAYHKFQDVAWQQDFLAELTELRKKNVFHENPLVRALLRDLSLLETAFNEKSLDQSQRMVSAFCDKCTIM